MQPVVSFIATLGLLGAVFTILHWLILWLRLTDLVALLLFALPVTAYIAWCMQEELSRQLRFGVQIYVSFAAVVVACAGIVFLIG